LLTKRESLPGESLTLYFNKARKCSPFLDAAFFTREINPSLQLNILFRQSDGVFCKRFKEFYNLKSDMSDNEYAATHVMLIGLIDIRRIVNKRKP
jgi:hypothetical protein